MKSVLDQIFFVLKPGTKHKLTILESANPEQASLRLEGGKVVAG